MLYRGGQKLGIADDSFLMWSERKPMGVHERDLTTVERIIFNKGNQLDD